MLINTDPNTGQISNFQASPSRLGLGTWQYAKDTALSIDQADVMFGDAVPNASILVADVTSNGCLPIAGHQQTVRRGIASLYKTWILGALATAVESGEILLDQIVTFAPGEYITAGANTTGQFEGVVEMTVQDAANLMMNVIDNGATDVLHELLGAAAVNDFARSSGHTNPDTLTPLLTVSQFAHLFGTVSSAQVDIFTGDDEAFGGEVFLFGLRHQWDRIWYKGGGHPGFATGTFLVRSDGWLVENNDGRAFAVIAMYNPDEEISDNPFVFDIQSLYARIHQLLTTR
ncbi:MAG: serine hydrolase [Actinobacteria bacterium]|nr:serine hydrolase [Actinomycetota bacterium]